PPEPCGPTVQAPRIGEDPHSRPGERLYDPLGEKSGLGRVALLVPAELCKCLLQGSDDVAGPDGLFLPGDAETCPGDVEHLGGRSRLLRRPPLPPRAGALPHRPPGLVALHALAHDPSRKLPLRGLILQSADLIAR